LLVKKGGEKKKIVMLESESGASFGDAALA
jgi:hypothetical protein